MEAIQKLRLLLNVCDKDDLLLLLLENAKETILSYIGRNKLPKELESIQIQLAIIAYNRQGTEGEISRSEGGVSQSFIDGLPQEFKEVLKNYPRRVGYIKPLKRKK